MRLFGLLVLLAGLVCGYCVSRATLGLHEQLQSTLPDYFSQEDIPSPYLANLSAQYERSKDKFQEVLEQGQEEIMEAVRRRNSMVQSRDRVTIHQEAYEQLILQADQEIDLLRLKDYYSRFFLHYFRWLGEGDAQSAVNSRLAQGQFKATLEYVNEKYSETPAFTSGEQEALGRIILLAEQGDRLIRWARVVVVVLIFLLVMGIPRFIRESGYKRFSASLYFDSLFRPRMLSDLNRWHSIKRLALALLLLYLFGLVLISSFISWRFPLVFGFLGLLPVFIFILMSGSSGRIPEMLVSFMAPKMLILILLLGIIAVRGTGLFWYLFWESGPYRGLLLSLGCMLVFYKFHVNTVLIRKWSHRNRRGSASILWMALGIQLLAAGALMYAFGPTESLHAMNRELMLLPGKLLGSPSALLFWIMISAGILTAGAALVFSLNRKKLHVPARST